MKGYEQPRGTSSLDGLVPGGEGGSEEGFINKDEENWTDNRLCLVIFAEERDQKKQCEEV